LPDLCAAPRRFVGTVLQKFPAPSQLESAAFIRFADTVVVIIIILVVIVTGAFLL
jgi:hypothetical protein